MSREKKIGCVVATFAAALCSGIAGADQWNLTYDGYGSNVKIGVSYDASKQWNSATRTSFSAIKIGEHKFHAGASNYSTFCVQVFEPVAVGETIGYCVVDVADVPDAPPAPGPMGAIAATLVQDLYWRFYSSIIDPTQSAADRNQGCAAFGLALYELTHENFAAFDATTAAAQANLFGGAFQADASGGNTDANSAVSLAGQMLSSLGDGGFHFFGNGLLGLTNPNRQDQLVVVPIPAVAGLSAAGLVVAAILRRRTTLRSPVSRSEKA